MALRHRLNPISLVVMKATIIMACAGLLSIAAAPAGAAAPGALQAAIGNPGFLRLSGSQRSRAEIISGQPRTAFRDEESLTSLRTTLLADIGDGPVHVVAEMYDSRAYGIADRSVVGTGEINSFELVQAHVATDLGAAAGPGSRAGLRAGRMILNLGSRRLVAADEYRNTTNSYTGLRADLAAGAMTATLIYVLPQYRLPDGFAEIRRNRRQGDRESFDLQLWGGVIGRRRLLGITDAEISFFRLIERDSSVLATRDRHLSTIDFRLQRPPAPGAFDHEIEAAWQWGETRAGVSNVLPVQRVAAGFVHADAGYSFGGGWRPRLSVEFDYASGDRPGRRYTRFDTLFGMRRGDFSPSGLLASIGRTNIVAAGVRAEVVPSLQSDAQLTARAMWAASAVDGFATTGVRDMRGMSGRFAGYEIDGRWRQWLVKDRLRAEWNGTLLLHRGLMRRAPNAPAAPTTVFVSAALTTLF